MLFEVVAIEDSINNYITKGKTYAVIKELKSGLGQIHSYKIKMDNGGIGEVYAKRFIRVGFSIYYKQFKPIKNQ